jgi:hypothetical protein
MRVKVAVVCGAAIALALGVTASAGAATVTIGSPLTASFMQSSAGSVSTNAMVTGPNLASPVDGTVVNWRTLEFNGDFRPRVLQLGAGGVATATASGPMLHLNGGTVDTPLSMPINKGEVVGFDNFNPGDKADVDSSSSTYLSNFWSPRLVDNGPPQSPGTTGTGLEFGYNATVRYCLVPKLKGKKLGAAKKALANAACATGKVKKKGRGAKVVRSQSAPPGTSLADGAKVGLKLGKKPAKK